MIDTRDLAKCVRINALRMVHSARASHIGSALSIVDILTVLYVNVMRHDPKNPVWNQRDRFILSKGHACVALYALLAEFGYLSPDDLLTYGEDFSWLMNHASHNVRGVEFSTGALGHGLPFGVGKALSAKRSGEHWRVFVLLSDGEMDEGSNWEALMFASHHKLDNLTAIIDYNKLQSLGSVEETLNLEPLALKLSAFGCEVEEIDGHSHVALLDSLSKKKENKPKVVIAHTTKGKGVSFMENRVEWHYKSPDDVQLEEAIKELQINHA
jgi:transketolase